MTPLQRYQLDIQKRKIKTDEQQWQALQRTQRVFSELNIASQSRKKFFSSFFKFGKYISSWSNFSFVNRSTPAKTITLGK